MGHRLRRRQRTCRELARNNRAHKRLEDALRASYADLNRAQAVAHVGSWRVDIERHDLVWSDEYYEILGVAPGTPMTYQSFLACVHPDDVAYVDRAWTAALRGQPYDIEHRIVAHGETKWVREKADLEFDEHMVLVGGMGITQDITARKQHETELRQAHERYELALRGADLGGWDWDITSGLLVLTPRWAELRGFTLGELKQHVDTWISGVHPDDWPRVQRALHDCFEGRTAEYESEHRVRTKAGEWIWVLDRGKIFARNERGEPTRMAGTELDITARKRAEQDLRLAEAKSSGIVSISADAIVAIDAEQRITLFNEGAEKIFGYPPAEALGAPLEMLIPERFRARHRRDVARFAKGHAVARRMGTRGAEIFGLRKSGEEFPADAAISKLEVGGSKVLIVDLRDVTEQKRFEREQTFLADAGAVFVATLDYEQTLTNVAEVAVRNLADFCVVDMVDEPEVRIASRDPGRACISDLLAKLQIDRARPHLTHAVFETERAVLIEHMSSDAIAALAQSEEHLRALRALDPKSVMLVPLLAHGRLLGALAFVSTTESRAYGRSDLRLAEELALRAALAIENARLYAEVNQAIRTREDILGIVAHDLRNPLGTILMQAHLLRRPGAEPERRSRRPAETIDRAASRMNRLINDLLDVTRMEVGGLSLERSRVRTADVIRDAVDAQKAHAASAAIELRCELQQPLPPVWGDRDRLLQVFENLIGNALKFTERGGRITVGARAGARDVLFWVADTGSGIVADALPRVFDRFWQGAEARRHGAGLGLPIVKGLVEAHGGRVWAESTPGTGSTFFFTVPTGPEPRHRLSEPARSADRGYVAKVR